MAAKVGAKIGKTAGKVGRAGGALVKEGLTRMGSGLKGLAKEGAAITGDFGKGFFRGMLKGPLFNNNLLAGSEGIVRGIAEGAENVRQGRASRQGGVTITLTFEEGMRVRDFRKKAVALQYLADKGVLRRAPNPVVRDSNITAQYKNRLIRDAYERFGKTNPEYFERLRTRI
jgi:hypothetical protein